MDLFYNISGFATINIGTIVLAVLILTVVLCTICSRYIYKKLLGSKIAVIKSLAIPLTLATALACVWLAWNFSISIWIAFASDYLAQFEFFALALGASLPLVVVMPVLIFAGLVMVMWFLRIIINLIQKTTLYLFDKATAPETYPFSYFSALAGLVILVAKLALELANTWLTGTSP